MTSESPINPRQALEASLTALILGELPADQAEFLQRTISTDPELSKEYERLKKTIELVREVEVTPVKEPIAQAAPLKLSQERREKLLRHFKTVSPKEFATTPRRVSSWLVPVAAAAVLVAILASALLPSLSKAKFEFAGNASRNVSYAQLAAKSSEGRDREELRRLVQNQVAAGTEAVLKPLPKQQIASAVSAGPARNQSLIVLPSGGKPLTSSANAGESATSGLGWSGSATLKGFYDDSLAQSPPSGAVEFSVKEQSEHNHPGVWSSVPALAVGGLGGGTLDKSGATSFTQDGKKLWDERAGRSMLQEALPSSAEPGGAPIGLVEKPQGKPSLSLGGVATQASEAAARTDAEAAFSRRYGFAPTAPTPATPAERDKYKVDVTKEAGKPAAIGPITGLPVTPESSRLTLNYQNDIAFAVPAQQPASAPPPGLLGLKEDHAPNEAIESKLSTLGDEPKLGRELLADSKDQQEKPSLTLEGLTTKIGPIRELTEVKAPKEPLLEGRNNALSVTQTNSLPGMNYEDHMGAAAALPAGDQLISITPRSGGINQTAEEIVPRGTVNFPSTDLNQALQIYSELTGKTVLRPATLPNQPITLKTQTPLTKSEAIKAVDTALALNGISVVDFGEKFVKVVPASQAGQTGSSFKTNSLEQDQKLADTPLPKPAAAAPVPQPEVQTRENAFSTFSLNVSDVSFKLAAASLEKGLLPEAASIRSEEFINAFDYRDPEPAAGAPVAFAWERARYPFAQNRDLLRFSLKTAAQGRQAGRPLNIVLLLDNSGSMERADRVSIIREALRALAGQLQTQDTLSVVLFARTARLWVDGVPGNQAAQIAEQITGLTPEGGTNLEEAMNLAYQTALRHYLAGGINRVVLLTDGAANLGTVDPEALKKKVEANRKQGIALDCFGIGWEGYNDDLLEVLARNSDGRYGFINTPEEASTEFVGQLAGALQVAASDVKVQVEFNPSRVTAYRQIGYAKHQLTKEQFRDNTVDAAEIGAEESGNALYVIKTSPSGVGPLATVRARYKVPGTADYHEHEWTVPFTGNASLLEQSSPAMRLAATASAFSEWLSTSTFAAEVTPDALLAYLNGVPELYGADQRPRKLEWMVRQAKSISGK